MIRFVQSEMNTAAAQMKKPHLWLSVVIALALDLLAYHQVLAKLFPVESLRLTMMFLLCFVFFALTCFYHLDRMILPSFDLFTKPQRWAILMLGVFTPFVLAIAILDKDFKKDFLDVPVYFLLPSHAVRVEALPEGIGNGNEVILTGIYVQAQGAISYRTLEMQGWERRGNHLILTDPRNNFIQWKGKTGDNISITFLPQKRPVMVKIYWNNAEEIFSLFSQVQTHTVAINKKFEIPFYTGWLPLLLASYLSAGFGVFSLSVLLVSFSGFCAFSATKKYAWIVYAMPMYVVWLFYLLVFWPGSMSADSMAQWEQVITGQFVHAHPVAHTLTMWLITRIWFSPAAVALVQILVLGGILGWGISTLREYGYPPGLTWLVTIGMAASPTNSTLSITLWKDILFSAVVVALTILFFKVVVSDGGWLAKDFSWVRLGVTLTLVSLYRQNGPLVSFTSLLIIGFAYKGYWKQISKAGALFLSVYLLFNGPVFRILHVQLADMARSELVAAHLIAGHMEAKTPVVLENKKLLMPAMAVYPWPYVCYRNSDLFFSPGIDRAYLVQHSSEILSLALKATWQNPMKTVEHFACQGAMVYRIVEDYHYSGDWGFCEISPNKYGIVQSSILSSIRPLLTRFLEKTTSRNITWVIWGMPFWMYLSVFGVIIFCLRSKNRKPLLILTPGLLTVLPYIILTLGQIFRYVYSMYLIGILFSGYFLACQSDRKGDMNGNLN